MHLFFYVLVLLLQHSGCRYFNDSNNVPGSALLVLSI